MRSIRDALHTLARAWCQHTKFGFDAEYYRDVFMEDLGRPRPVRGYAEDKRTLTAMIVADLPRLPEWEDE